MERPAESNSPRARLHWIIEAGLGQDLASRAFDAAVATLIVLNVAAVALETVTPLYLAHKALFDWFEHISVAVFSAEYVLRLWTAVEQPGYRGLSPSRARLKYALTPYALIDLAAVLPSLLAYVALPDLRFLRILRLIRILKLGRYSPALSSLGQVFYEERRALGATLLIIAAVLMFAASGMHFIEGAIQPTKFGTIPDALWWALVTLATVGYGDVVPVTPLGKLFAGAYMILCLGIYALPVGIIASGFAREIHKRDFVISWSMVARVPLFAGLAAAAIGEIATLLRSRVVEANTVIARRGAAAESMYFIVSGEVEIRAGATPIVLSDGEFFGEMALLRRSERTTTAVARSKTRLMVLEAADFHHLIETHSNIRKAIMLTAKARGADFGDGEGGEAPKGAPRAE